MKLDVGFVAKDGSMFDSAAACVVYETQTGLFDTSPYHHGMIMYNSFGSKILNNNISNICEEAIIFTKDTGAVLIFNKEKAEEFFIGISAAGLPVPSSRPGLYIRDFVTDKWTCFDDDIQRVKTVGSKYFFID